MGSSRGSLEYLFFTAIVSGPLGKDLSPLFLRDGEGGERGVDLIPLFFRKLLLLLAAVVADACCCRCCYCCCRF